MTTIRERWDRLQRKRLAKRVARTTGRTRTILGVATVTCPRCRRSVAEEVHAREAHRQSCVRIPSPEDRAPGWGVKLPASGTRQDR